MSYPVNVAMKQVDEDNRNGLPTRNVALVPVAGGVYAQGLASAYTLAPPAGADLAVVSIDTQAARYRDDGAAPTATTGIYLAIGVYNFYNADLSKLQFIAQTAGALLNVAYYKYVAF